LRGGVGKCTASDSNAPCRGEGAIHRKERTEGLLKRSQTSTTRPSCPQAKSKSSLVTLVLALDPLNAHHTARLPPRSSVPDLSTRCQSNSKLHRFRTCRNALALTKRRSSHLLLPFLPLRTSSHVLPNPSRLRLCAHGYDDDLCARCSG
jgi:hypothetical protein